MTTTEDGARLADEIRLLVDLVVERAQPWLDSVLAAGHGGGHAGSGAGAADATDHGEGRGEAGGDQGDGDRGDSDRDDGENRAEGTGRDWCPLCAVVAVFRGERVDVAARVLEHAAQLLALLRAVLADRWAPHEGVHMPGFQPRPEPGPTRSARVQHVAVTPRGQWNPDADDRR